MFKILLSTILLSFVIADAYALKASRKERSGPACELCTLVLGAAKTLLQKNQTEVEIISFIEKELCDRLGPLSGICGSFMETDGMQILTDLANGVDPASVCKKFGLCTASSARGLSNLETFIQDKASLNCTVCKLVMGQIQNLLNGNQTEAQIIDYMENHVCKLLGPLASICDSLIEQYGPQVIKLLSQKVDPEKVCEIIGMCTNKTMVRTAMRNKMDSIKSGRTKERSGPFCEICTLALTAAKSLLQKNETDDEVISFIEKQLCARLGPLNGTCVNLMETEGRQILADLANGVDPASVCKKFGLCSMESRKLKNITFDTLKSNPIECTVCQYVIQFLDVELKGNKTEAAIVNALKNVCNLTPASLKPQCQNLINTYGVYLVQLLFEFSDPLKVCEAVKAC